MLDLLKGKRRQSLPITMTALVANATAVYQVSNFANMLGAKTFRIKRLKIRNNGAGNTWLHIGTGAAGTFVNMMTALYTVNNTTDDYEEADLPDVEFAADMTAYPDAIAALGTMEVMAEVEEIG